MTSISAKVGPWIDEAIEDHGMGENILWESALLPGPDGVPLFTVVVWLPGAVLGTVVNGSVQITDPLGITKEDIDASVSNFLLQIREARSQQIAAESKRATHVPPRGAQTPSGLLIG